MMSAVGGAGAAGAAQPPKASDLEVRDITDLICKADCYCLNQLSGTTWENLFQGDDRLLLKSDADEQLLLHVGFMETVKLHSIDFVAPADDSAPSTVKLYLNRHSMGFSDTDDMSPAQTLELTQEDLVAGSASVLKFVKFQRVTGLSIFVADNNGAEQSCLSSLRFFGSPVATTNMGDFKKVEEAA
ncbi:unnamed protein product [Pylaiella littoralis]